MRKTDTSYSTVYDDGEEGQADWKNITHHNLSVGGDGTLMANVPVKLFRSTLSISLVLDTSSMAFLIYLFSVACWKRWEPVILSTKRRNFLPVPPECCLKEQTQNSYQSLHHYLQYLHCNITLNGLIVGMNLIHECE